MDHHSDIDSIDIISSISFYEEVDLPQTDEFADWLVYLGKKSPLDSLNIVSNLLCIVLINGRS